MADETKAWWKSKTILAAIADFLVNLYHVLVPVLLQFGVNLPEIPPFVIVLLNSLLGGTIIYGRWTANTTISPK